MKHITLVNSNVINYLVVQLYFSQGNAATDLREVFSLNWSFLAR